MKKYLTLVLALLMVMSVCVMPAALADDVTTIVWYLPSSTPANFDSVMAAVNEKLAPSGLKLDLRPVEWGDYEQKMQLISSSRQECDIMWVSSWSNDYVNNVSNGALLPIDEYLPQVPALNDLLASYWQYMVVSGSIYGVPVLQIMANEPGIVVRKDIVEKYDLDLSGIHDYTDLDEIYALVAEKEAGVMYPTANMSVVQVSQLWDDDAQDYVYYPTVEGYLIDMDTLTVASPETRGAFELAYRAKVRDWYLKNYISKDLPTMSDQEALWASGQAFSKQSRVKPGNEAEVKAASGYDVIGVSMGKPIIDVGSARSTVCGISSCSEHPLEALKLLEIVNTDAEIYNLLIFGIEDQDYTRIDDTHIAQIPGAYGMGAWEVGNQFNAFLTEGQEDGIWEATLELNESAMADPLGDFSFDRSKVETEMANVLAIREEYENILRYGLDDPEALMAERDAKLAQAGEQAIIDEINAQLSAWAAK